MWRERIGEDQIAETVERIDETGPNHVASRWSRTVRAWRADLLAIEGVSEEEAEAEVARGYALAWCRSRMLRKHLPIPTLVAAWRASRSAAAQRDGTAAAKAKRALAALPRPAVRVPSIGAMGTERRRVERPGWR